MAQQPTKELGDTIRAARDRARLSTQAAAEEARISPAYLNKLEAGRVGTPSPRVLHRLSVVIDVPYWTLMDLADYVPADDADRPDRHRPAPTAGAGEAATNERLLELLQAIKSGVDALEAGQRQLLAERPPG
jgi:transcriptional regulator with XRE-family HTH domain